MGVDGEVRRIRRLQHHLDLPTDKVLLECPIYGNAAYVIDAEEEVWREMTKQELAESGLAEKIPHRGDDWPTKVRRALDFE